MPPIRQTSVTYKRALKATAKAAEQQRIFGKDDDYMIRLSERPKESGGPSNLTTTPRQVTLYR